jgi:hypothetical protein
MAIQTTISNVVFPLLCNVYANAVIRIHKLLSPGGTIFVEKLTVAQILKNLPSSYGARRLNTTKIMPIRFVKQRIVANVSEQYSASILSGKLSLTLKIKALCL